MLNITAADSEGGRLVVLIIVVMSVLVPVAIVSIIIIIIYLVLYLLNKKRNIITPLVMQHVLKSLLY